MTKGKKSKRIKIVSDPNSSGFVKLPPGRLVKRKALTYNSVWFTRHALDRMKERIVSEEEVFEVLDVPDKKGLPTGPRRFRWRKGTVDVVFEKTPDQLRIITVIK